MLKWFAVILEGALAVQTLPVFTLEMWPGEGIPHFTTAVPSITIHDAPLTTYSGAVQVQLPLGSNVGYSETRHQTIEPGLLIALAETIISGRNFQGRRQLSRQDYYHLPVPRGDVTVAAGDTVEYLQYRAEGTCFVRVDGEVWDASFCPTMREDVFILLAEPVVEWWVRTEQAGVPPGWLLVTDSTLTIRRSF